MGEQSPSKKGAALEWVLRMTSHASRSQCFSCYDVATDSAIQDGLSPGAAEVVFFFPEKVSGIFEVDQDFIKAWVHGGFDLFQFWI